ncbi:hypothetical protein [Streptomyces sp. BA2]|uniref:hypothetical protein n=1 Tax=Streptomyces sp. BA2 TaxID=436595 RepID=UPI003014F1C8
MRTVLFVLAMAGTTAVLFMGSTALVRAVCVTLAVSTVFAVITVAFVSKALDTLVRFGAVGAGAMRRISRVFSVLRVMQIWGLGSVMAAWRTRRLWNSPECELSQTLIEAAGDMLSVQNRHHGLRRRDRTPDSLRPVVACGIGRAREDQQIRLLGPRHTRPRAA